MILLSTVLALSVAAAPAKPKLLLLDVQAIGGATPALAQSLTQAVASEVTARGYFDVITSGDVTTLLGVERQKQLLGCSDDSGAACMAELGGAMGARNVLSGTISRLGEAYQLNLQLFDNQKARVLHRATRLAKDEASLTTQVIYAVAEATGAPLPPPPSKLPAIGLLAGGGAVLVVGAALGIFTLTQESAISSELAQGKLFPQVLKSYEYYQRERANAGLYRTLSLVGLGVGAALVAAGVYFFPADVVTSSSLKVAWAPAPGGFAVAGSF